MRDNNAKARSLFPPDHRSSAWTRGRSSLHTATTHLKPARRSARPSVRLVAYFAACVTSLVTVSSASASQAVAPPAAQQRPTLTPADYGKFESLVATALSPDGRWLAYGVRTVDEHLELRVRPVDGDATRVYEWASSPSFSPDSRWLTFTVGVSPEERERSDGPIRNRLLMLDLQSDSERSFEQVRARAFDESGRFLALHGYAPGEPAARGADLRVIDVSTGVETTFGNVGAFEWSDSGPLLAMLISTGAEQGNGVQLYDPRDGRLRTLESSGSSYRHMSWRDDAADLVVLRSEPPMGADSTLHTMIVWRGLDRSEPTRLMLDARPAGLPAPLGLVGFTAPNWSDDGTKLSFGARPVSEEDDAGSGVDAGAQPARGAGAGGGAVGGGRGGRGGQGRGGRGAGSAGGDEPVLPGVQIWHTSDVAIYPQQRSRAGRRARSTLLSVWLLDEDRVVQVGTDLDESASLAADWRVGFERMSGPYAWGEMFGRPYHDLWTVDLSTGERTLALERNRYTYPSDGGRYVLSFDGEDFWSLDLGSGARVNLTANLDGIFARTDYDTPTDLLPNHGIGGWLQDDEAVFLYDEHDVWRVAPDGSGGERITRGYETGLIHRLLGIGEESDGYRADRQIYLSLREEATERRGFARMRLGRPPEVLALDDASLAALTKADSADVFMYRREARDVSENLFIAGPDLADPHQVTDTNPFLSDYAWTHAELFHFRSEAGTPLKGVLLYPANHDPSRRYPMIVYTYELLSQGMHSFQVPSERSYYNYTVWTQQGYFVLLPDIKYRWGEPGVSAVEAVRPAVGAVVERGLVDPARVGLIGHSWGGYQAAYIPTRTGDLFAASVAGAPLTDFVSFMGQIHWSGGAPELSHWETGQGRMEVPYWEDVDSHLRNSPLHEVDALQTPMLMAFGDEDGTVEWWQGTVFYNFARRAGKQMVLLVYEGEGHGFSQEPNQVDYHRRILEWFGHYLKGEPAPAWITDGVAFEDLEAEKLRVARPAGAAGADDGAGGGPGAAGGAGGGGVGPNE